MYVRKECNEAFRNEIIVIKLGHFSFSSMHKWRGWMVVVTLIDRFCLLCGPRTCLLRFMTIIHAYSQPLQIIDHHPLLEVQINLPHSTCACKRLSLIHEWYMHITINHCDIINTRTELSFCICREMQFRAYIAMLNYTNHNASAIANNFRLTVYSRRSEMVNLLSNFQAGQSSNAIRVLLIFQKTLHSHAFVFATL